MLRKYLSPLGINAASAYAAAGLSVFLSIGVWIFDKSDDRGTRERLAIFVGLWAPTLMGLGNALEKPVDSALRS
ncbi:MAG: hypothetical protein NVS2B16_23580 [Chloroflexota bacterium]